VEVDDEVAEELGGVRAAQEGLGVLGAA
jgi:hypothetical protein